MTLLFLLGFAWLLTTSHWPETITIHAFGYESTMSHISAMTILALLVLLFVFVGRFYQWVISSIAYWRMERKHKQQFPKLKQLEEAILTLCSPDNHQTAKFLQQTYSKSITNEAECLYRAQLYKQTGNDIQAVSLWKLAADRYQSITAIQCLMNHVANNKVGYSYNELSSLIQKIDPELVIYEQALMLCLIPNGDLLTALPLATRINERIEEHHRWLRPQHIPWIIHYYQALNSWNQQQWKAGYSSARHAALAAPHQENVLYLWGRYQEQLDSPAHYIKWIKKQWPKNPKIWLIDSWHRALMKQYQETSLSAWQRLYRDASRQSPTIHHRLLLLYNALLQQDRQNIHNANQAITLAIDHSVEEPLSRDSHQSLQTALCLWAEQSKYELSFEQERKFKELIEKILPSSPLVLQPKISLPQQ